MDELIDRLIAPLLVNDTVYRGSQACCSLKTAASKKFSEQEKKKISELKSMKN